MYQRHSYFFVSEQSGLASSKLEICIDLDSGWTVINAVIELFLVIMVTLRVIPRTATFTWSPGASSQFIATGTRAGAIDADFSNLTQLELWDLDLNSESQCDEVQLVASIDTDSR